MLKRARRKTSVIPKWKRLLSGGLFVLGAFLMLTACGGEVPPESGQVQESGGKSEPDETGSGETKEENKAGAGDTGQREDGLVAVGDFYYMPLDTYALNDRASTGYYAIDGEWLYYAREVNTAGEGGFPPNYCIYISRGRISDGWQEEDYIVQTKNTSAITLHALLADGHGNCYVFWGPGYTAEEEDKFYSLEKYGREGELLWRADYSPEELESVGDALNQGTVTAEGRVFLYTIGKDGKVFAFDPEGGLTGVYAPELKVLDGVATGKDGKAYGYCITEGEPTFAELGDAGEKYPCPEGILEVYDGRGSDPCVRDGSGVWNYTPETGEMERLWEWEDEYIQIAADDVDAFFRDGETFVVLCSEQDISYFEFSMDRRPIETFAVITLEDSGKYPPKQRITLGTATTAGTREGLSMLALAVRRYNRQSRDYKVEFVDEDSEYSMQMKFIQGKCADIIDLTYIYAGNLAGIGAFEDLTAYYEASGIVRPEDILEPVREACILAGRNVLVMPSFHLMTLVSLEEEVTVKDWDVWEFLERAEEEWLILGQDPVRALMYCMGVRCGENYIDYENKQCHFDSPEFRRLLEACGRVRTYEGNVMTGNNHSLFTDERIAVSWDVVDGSLLGMSIGGLELGKSSDRIVGYPGMDGAEYKLYPDSVFAINSASDYKEGAWDFLEFLLSEETQSMITWCFPSRKDVFEQSLSDIYVSPTRTRILPFIDDTGKPMENGYAKEVTAHDVAILRGMVENAKYDSWGGSLSPLWDIVADEAGMYFKGDADLDATISKIQNRVQLYLDEE